MSPEPATATTAEPVVLYQSVAIVVCAALAAFGVIVDPSVVGTAILVVVGLVTSLVAAFKARAKVTPVATP